MAKNYVLYGLSGVRKVVSVDWFDAAGDDEAIAKLQSIGSGVDGEVWDGRRFVARTAVQNALLPDVFRRQPRH